MYTIFLRQDLCIIHHLMRSLLQITRSPVLRTGAVYTRRRIRILRNHSLFISGKLVLILLQKSTVVTQFSDALLICVWNYLSNNCAVYFSVAMMFFRVIRFLQSLKPGCGSTLANAIFLLLYDFSFEKIQRFFCISAYRGYT